MLRRIASIMRVPLKRISVSGVKDKRGVTTQLVTVQGATKGMLQRIRIPGVRLGDIQPVVAPLNLGDHSGNHFEIVLRDLKLIPATDGSV